MKHELEQLLMEQAEYLIDGKLNKNKLSELARKYDAKLLSILMSKKLVKEQFFVTIVTNNEQRTTNNEQRTTNNEQRTTNNEQRTDLCIPIRKILTIFK